ncbi:hypothetical protein D3C84_336770 [compost metagenome]
MLQGVFGNAQLRAGSQANHALIGEVVDGEQGRRALPAPVHVGRGQACGPVVGVHQIRAPVQVRQVGRDIRGSQAQAGEPDMVVRPVTTVVGAIGRAFAFVQLRADQYVDHQAVGHVHAPDLAGRQGGVATQLANDVNRVVAVHHLRVTGDQYPHIVQVGHGAGQCGRHVPQAAGLHQVGDFRGHEQHFLFVRIVTLSRQYRF